MINHKHYIKSSNWLIKKSELVTAYLKDGFSIACLICDIQSELHVHHINYDNLGDENVYRDLCFLCRECHRKWHFEEGFKHTWLKKWGKKE